MFKKFHKISSYLDQTRLSPEINRSYRFRNKVYYKNDHSLLTINNDRYYEYSYKIKFWSRGWNNYILNNRFLYIGDGNSKITKILLSSGNSEFYRKNDLPTVIYYNICKCWYNGNGVLHRENDLPAKETMSGSKVWYKHGVIYREGGKPEMISEKFGKEYKYVDYSFIEKNEF